LVIIELIAAIVFAIGWVYALVVLFQRRRIYPMAFNVLTLGTLVFGAFDMAVVVGVLNQTPAAADTRELIRALVNSLIWIPYMVKSVRVRNTFVN
jgi:Protein of unknown function (DUF2569)